MSAHALRAAAIVSTSLAIAATPANAQRAARGAPDRPLRAESVRDTAVASLVRAEHAFARDVAARRLDAWVETFADDGAMFPQRAAVAVGRTAVRAVMEKTFADTSVRVAWLPVYAEVARSGDLGFTYGYARWSWRDSTGAVAAQGNKYGTVWRRDASGRWKVIADFGNDAPVPAGFFDGK